MSHVVQETSNDENLGGMHPDDVFNILMDEDALLLDEYSDCETRSEGCAEAKPRKRKRLSDSSQIKGLIEMSLAAFERGDYGESSKLAMQSIRLDPSSSGLAYGVLGQISERAGDSECALKWSYLSAIITKNDFALWSRCAQLCPEDIPKLTRCYNNMVRLCPRDKDLQMERYRLLRVTNNRRRLMDCYRSLLHCFEEDDSQYERLFRELCQFFYEGEAFDRSADVLVMALRHRPDLVTEEDVGHLIELLVLTRNWRTIVEVARDVYGVVVEWLNERVIRIFPGSHLPVWVCSGVVMGLCGLGCSHVSTLFVEEILRFDVGVFGSYYQAAAEALMGDQHYFLAECLLERMTEQTNRAELWQMLGDCAGHLGKLQKAIFAYETALDQKHFSTEISMALAGVQQRLGFSDRAIRSVGCALGDTGEQIGLETCLLLLERAQAFAEGADLENSYHALRKALFSHLWPHQNTKLIRNCLCSPKFPEFRDRGGESVRLVCRSEILLRSRPDKLGEVWGLFRRVGQYLLEAAHYQRLAKFSCFGLLIPAMAQSPPIRFNLVYMSVLAYTMTEDWLKAFTFLRTLLLAFPDHAFVWNYFCRISQTCLTRRFDRFCLRQRNRSARRVLPLHIMTASFAMSTGKYKFAYLDLMEVLPRLPEDPLLHLLLAICLLGIISLKYTANRQHLYVTMLAFFHNYSRFRGNCQEVFYNIGRAMHQLNLRNVAIHYYEKCLSLSPLPDDSFDLRPRAAYNLTRMVKDCAVVQHYYETFLTI